MIDQLPFPEIVIRQSRPREPDPIPSGGAFYCTYLQAGCGLLDDCSLHLNLPIAPSMRMGYLLRQLMGGYVSCQAKKLYRPPFTITNVSEIFNNNN